MGNSAFAASVAEESKEEGPTVSVYSKQGLTIMCFMGRHEKQKILEGQPKG